MPLELLLAVAILIDLLLGDPRWLPHPIRGIGFLLLGLERAARAILPPLAAGRATVCCALLITGGATSLLLWATGLLSPLSESLLTVYLLYSFLAVKDLISHSNEVYQALVRDEDLVKAREKVGMIVGRDTAGLDQRGVVRACVETVAENMVDGITAPIFWAVIFSSAATTGFLSSTTWAAVGICLYKTVNTMDSMFGYKNERYLLFGRAAARLDDAANFLPSRLSSLIIPIAAQLLGQNGKNSFAVLRRDRFNHASPNAGHPEAAVAGALDITLGGPSSYFGSLQEKPFIGAGTTELAPEHIRQTNALVLLSTLIFLICLLLARKICIWLTLVLL